MRTRPIGKGATAWRIGKLHAIHECDAIVPQRNSTVSTAWVVSALQEPRADDKTRGPKKLQRELKRKHGITIDYTMVRRARKIIIGETSAAWDEEYSKLATYLHRLQEAMPDSYIVSFHDPLFAQWHDLIFASSVIDAWALSSTLFSSASSPGAKLYPQSASGSPSTLAISRACTRALYW